jgi:phosphatidylglycerophosphate synthase
MNLRAFPLLAVVVLSATGKIWTWWGIAIMVLCLVGGSVAALAAQKRGRAYVESLGGPEMLSTEEEISEGQERDAVLGYVFITLPAFGAAIGGSLISWWAALAAGVVAAYVCSALFSVVVQPKLGTSGEEDDG